MKKIVYLTLTALLVFICSACADLDYYIDYYIDSYEKNYYEKAIKSVEEKYGIKIEPFRYENGGFVSSSNIIRGHVEGLNEEKEYIQILIHEEDGKTVYKDNYLNYAARPMIEEHLQEFFSPHFDECKIYYVNEITYHPNTLNQYSTIEDIVEESEYYLFDSVVFIKEDGSTQEEYAERIAQVENAIMESTETIRIKVYIVDEESYNQMDRYNRIDFIEENNYFDEPDNVTLFYYHQEFFVDGKRFD